MGKRYAHVTLFNKSLFIYYQMVGWFERERERERETEREEENWIDDFDILTYIDTIE